MPPSSGRPIGPTAVDVGGVRAVNLARVLAAALAAPTPPTRAALATATGTTRATASRLVDDLVAGGLLEESAPDAGLPRGPGRPGTHLSPGRGVAALGLQVDVDRVAAVVTDLTGAVRASHVTEGDFRGSRPEGVLGLLADVAGRAIAEVDATVVGARLALPGIVDGRGVLLRAPNLGWSDVAVAAVMPPVDGLPAPVVGNEADLGAVTVSYPAPGRPGEHADFVYLSGAAGIGGSVVLDGAPLRGRHGWAGELGHVTVDPDGPDCACGSTGCLEQYAGMRALAVAAGLEPTARTSDIARAARDGEPAAAAAVERAAEALGIALSAVVNVVDVPVIVLAGHLREIGDLVRPTLLETLTRRVLSARWAPPVVEVAPQRPLAAAVGAAYAELHALVADPGRRLGRRRTATPAG
ncbi:ROK family protein [Phycicoccus sp. BSK3Z-2]|uniref:ROK family protein n=1 Tax=Phycicoccus avicenniae TaxID=2828860 RepID=A0A941DEG7_9MICO|nr:ROK family protein [Phycicoccus avicenniae]MBR7744822.1 ROK family protein [Phycicoccus avicenniae]